MNIKSTKTSTDDNGNAHQDHPRKKYSKPEIEQESVFERYALTCGRTTDDCIPDIQNS